MIDSTRDFFDTLAKVLIRCWLLGTLLLLFSFVIFMLTDEIIDDIHGRMFGVTPHELDLIIYGGMARHKLCVNVFSLFPWLAIRWVLRKEKGKPTP
jgi:type IV secretory pathway VirB6-like protein